MYEFVVNTVWTTCPVEVEWLDDLVAAEYREETSFDLLDYITIPSSAHVSLAVCCPYYNWSEQGQDEVRESA